MNNYRVMAFVLCAVLFMKAIHICHRTLLGTPSFPGAAKMLRDIGTNTNVIHLVEKRTSHELCSSLSCFDVFWYRTNLTISVRVTSQTLGQSYDCLSVSEATLNIIGQCVMWMYLCNPIKQTTTESSACFVGYTVIVALAWQAHQPLCPQIQMAATLQAVTL